MNKNNWLTIFDKAIAGFHLKVEMDPVESTIKINDLKMSTQVAEKLFNKPDKDFKCFFEKNTKGETIFQEIDAFLFNCPYQEGVLDVNCLPIAKCTMHND